MQHLDTCVAWQERQSCLLVKRLADSSTCVTTMGSTHAWAPLTLCPSTLSGRKWELRTVLNRLVVTSFSYSVISIRQSPVVRANQIFLKPESLIKYFFRIFFYIHLSNLLLPNLDLSIKIVIPKHLLP